MLRVGGSSRDWTYGLREGSTKELPRGDGMQENSLYQERMGRCAQTLEFCCEYKSKWFKSLLGGVGEGLKDCGFACLRARKALY